MLRGETVTFRSPGSTLDPYSGVQVRGWTTWDEWDADNVLVEPRPVGETQLDARNQVVSGYTLYCQNGIDPMPSPYDRVEVRGVVYEVDGEPALWQMVDYSPGVVVQAKTIEG